jgi:excisionase family DNA binding protein
MAAKHLSARKAADRLEVSPQTILRWIERGVFPGTRLFGGLYRIPVEEVERVQREGPDLSPVEREAA